MTQKDTGGPAFPRQGVKDGYGNVVGDAKGMTLRQYAAITLRHPDSGTDWLDDMIRAAKRDDFAGQVVTEIMPDGRVKSYAHASEEAYKMADAMLEARK